MTRHDARAHYSDGLSIAFPAINGLLDVIHVPHDADFGCRSYPTGIDTNNPIYRKLLVARRPQIGFKDVV